MDLIVALEQRFARTPDGAAWTTAGVNNRQSWSRYLGVFQRVRLLARVQDVGERSPQWLRADGDGVELLGVPYYIGPAEYLRRFLDVERAVRAGLAAHPRDAVILRVPGTIGTVAGRALRATARPFAVEVIGDPHDVFAPGASDHPLRALIRWNATANLRRLCAEAAASLYVTREALQRRYPSRTGTPSFGVSDAETAEEAYVAGPRPATASAGPPFRIVHVGTCEALYKAPDLLIEAAARAAADGLDLELVIIGDGRLRGELEALACARGLGERVRFTGLLPAGEPIRRELDRAHLFVLPSRQEGLPRAMVEAMARGLPCLGTAVGGIPELLPPSALVPADAAALAARIRAVAASAELRAEMSRQNLARARDYLDRTLQPRRLEFYRTLVALTVRWAGHGRRPALGGEDHAATA